MYTELQPERILETAGALNLRISERFPGSGLSRVGGEVRRLAADVEAVSQRLRRPIWPLRVGTIVGILAMLGVMVGLVLVGLRVSPRVTGVADLLQAIESAVNEIILLALAICFLVSLEGRFKRRIALRALHRLRSLAHIVDMHQLTKDPERLLSPEMKTASSPKYAFTRFELARYLDYCSELLALISKLAALHVQYLHDPVVLTAGNDIETLAASLSGKIWQKIMILDLALPEQGAPGA